MAVTSGNATAMELMAMSNPQSKETVSKKIFLAKINRIDKLEAILRQINATEDAPHVADRDKVAIMACLARSVLS